MPTRPLPADLPLYLFTQCRILWRRDYARKKLIPPSTVARALESPMRLRSVLLEGRARGGAAAPRHVSSAPLRWRSRRAHSNPSLSSARPLLPCIRSRTQTGLAYARTRSRPPSLAVGASDSPMHVPFVRLEWRVKMAHANPY